MGVQTSHAYKKVYDTDDDLGRTKRQITCHRYEAGLDSELVLQKKDEDVRLTPCCVTSLCR